jgi:hypothetical protein
MRAILCVLAMLVASAANAAGIEDVIKATCRITAPGGNVGTGVATEVTGEYVGVLTNAHVVANHATVQCQFYREGFESQPVTASVAARTRTNDVDAALVVVRRSVFADYSPPAVKLAPMSYVVAPGEKIASVGCANGSWPTAWIGHAVGYDQNAHLIFRPAPADGRSGSAVFNTDGDLVGLIFAREESGLGMACSVQAMRRELAAASPSDKFIYTGQTSLVSWTPTQCGPQPCGPGGCDPNSFRQRRQGQQQQRPQGGQIPQGGQGEQLQIGNSPWPGFGEAKPEKRAADPAVLDALKAIADTQAKIAASLNKEPKSEMAPIPATPEKPVGSDPETLKVLQQIGVATQQNATDIQVVDKKVGKLEEAVRPALKFQEFKDEIKEKLAGKQQEPADSKLESKIAHVLWTVLVACAVFAVVSFLYLCNKGVGLVGKFTAERAARHPDNQRYQAAAERCGDLDADVLDFARKSPTLKKLVKAKDQDTVAPAPDPVAPAAQAPQAAA